MNHHDGDCELVFRVLRRLVLSGVQIEVGGEGLNLTGNTAAVNDVVVGFIHRHASVVGEVLREMWEHLHMPPADVAWLCRPVPAPCPVCGGIAIHGVACQTVRETTKMTFGKHNGTAIAELPDGYLDFLVETVGRDRDCYDVAVAERDCRASERETRNG